MQIGIRVMIIQSQEASVRKDVKLWLARWWITSKLSRRLCSLCVQYSGKYVFAQSHTEGNNGNNPLQEFSAITVIPRHLETGMVSLTRIFSVTNKTDNKHIKRIASSRKLLRVLFFFGGAATFSQTWTSFLPTTDVPDRPIKMRGTPFFSTVCSSGQYESMSSACSVQRQIVPSL